MPLNLELNEERFLGLLDKLIGETESLQNNPPEQIPREDNASNHVLEILKPYTKENGGPLIVRRVTYHEGRGNVIIEYPGTTDNTCAFVGEHLDVVPASRDTWERDPFKLSVEGDFLYGRGTTDCLGHVALVTDLMISLAILKPKLKSTIAAVFIANEENSSISGVGVDALVENKEIEKYKNGTVFWIDSADTHNCLGTAGRAAWEITASGKLFHSGLPNKTVNAIELANAAVLEIQKRFHKDFPAHEKEKEYNFLTGSSLKPTQIACPPGGLNQIPGSATIKGDIRLTPFYDISVVAKKVEEYVADINANINELPTPYPYSKFELPEENLKGSIKLTWLGEQMNGLAVDMKSAGLQAMLEATKEVVGDSKPYSLTGGLPLVKELQDEGFDIQVVGYGLMSKYHADNECAKLSDFKNGLTILSKTIDTIESKL